MNLTNAIPPRNNNCANGSPSAPPTESPPPSNTEHKQISAEDAERYLQLWQKLVKVDPPAFRARLRLEPESRPLAEIMPPWQEESFTALDPAWKTVAGLPAKTPILRRAWIERPRGHAKTTDMAVQIAWVLLATRRPIQGICAAADRDQGNLILQAVARLIAANPGLPGLLRMRASAVESRQQNARLEVISSDVGSSFGLTPDFVICDELSHWPDQRLWHSLLSAAAKRPESLLVVLTNAGVGRGWQWEARQAAQDNPAWFFTTLDGPQAPWLSPKDLDEQRAMLPPAVYDRLWNNRWQAAEGNYLTAEEVALCCDQQLQIENQATFGRRYIAAIDYAEKHDRTAAVLMHSDGQRLVVDRLDVIAPRPGSPVLVSWVEDWITRISAAFPQTTFVIDEYQLLGTFQRLGRRFSLVRFPFAGGQGNHELAVTLRRMIVHRQIAWYPGCGALADHPEDTLESELAELVLKQAASGRIRFDTAAGGHDDRAFVLAAAAWWAQTNSAPRWQTPQRSPRRFLRW